MDTDVTKMTDIELAEVLSQVWVTLSQAQANLQIITAEIKKRKTVKVKDETPAQ
jgi:uncharacterized coiled-coil protein SlyX